MRLVWGAVERIDEETEAAQWLAVRLDSGEPAPAVSFPSLAGCCRAGDRVLLNTTAVDLGLGTGGHHIVVARAGEGVALDDPSPGHIMKLRYTPMQREVLAVEEPASEAHRVMAEVRSLDGMPVVCCGLHSQIPLVAAAAKERVPDLRIAYVMSDGAALPLAVSRLAPRLLETGLIDTTITCGQAFGGALEAVNVHSGLLAARHVAGVQLALVGIGPGIPGTATPFGHGGVAQGEAINAVAALGGVPIAVLRVSFADPRPRHVPVSHQTISALVDVALRPALVPVPGLEAPNGEALELALEQAGVWHLHERRRVPVGLPDLRGVEVRTMGRDLDDDPAFFLAAAAAGLVGAGEAGRRE